MGYIDLKWGYMGQLPSDFDKESKFKVTWKILKQAHASGVSKCFEVQAADSWKVQNVGGCEKRGAGENFEI